MSVGYDKRDPDSKIGLDPVEVWRLYRKELDARVDTLSSVMSLSARTKNTPTEQAA